MNYVSWVLLKIYRESVQLLLGRYVLGWPRYVKRTIVLAIDVGFCVFAVWLAFYLRLGYFSPLTGQPIWAVFTSVVLAVPIFIKAGLYRAVFRYSGLPAMITLGRSMLLYGTTYAAIFTFWTVEGIPRTIGLIQPILLMVLVGGSRATARVWLGGMYQRRLRRASLPQALIYGASDAGSQLASAMSNSSEINVVGFFEDDDRLHGSFLNGLPIYNPSDIAEVLSDHHITNILLALPRVSRQRRNEIINSLKSYKLSIRTLPSFSDIATGRVSVNNLRDLDIHDLLGREPVKPDDLLLNLNTNNKTVMVTGAGGSIGSELCRQILNSKPSRLLIVDMCEFALYQIHEELQNILMRELPKVSQPIVDDVCKGDAIVQLNNVKCAEIEIIPLLASVCDERHINRIMRTWKPQTVYHAAAYKHVPIVEHNPAEGVRNNVWGTLVCAEAALRNNVHKFVLISTDKAVRPTNIMGASKRLAEMVLQALAESPNSFVPQGSTDNIIKTNFSIVRFGNVLGSSGSVVPRFREQVKYGGPVTVTHIDITRYFMTIPEAAQLVIQAGAMGQGGDVFVLDMGQPVKIIDLARRVIEMSGLSVRDDLNPGGDIEIAMTGLRPGEKLYEELLIGDCPEATQHPRIMKAREQHLNWPELKVKLESLGVAISANDVFALREILQQAVNGYQPNGDVVDLEYLAGDKKVANIGRQ
jgi:FlaA1/EpsC-like NDP-sugar epimerase